MAVFAVTFTNVSITLAQDLFELVAPSNSRVRVREITFGQHSDAGDAAAEMLALTVIRGHTSGGSSSAAAPTPANLEPWGPSSGATVAVNDTGLASGGSPAVLIADTFNVQGGYKWGGGDNPNSATPFADGYIYLSP